MLLGARHEVGGQPGEVGHADLDERVGIRDGDAE